MPTTVETTYPENGLVQAKWSSIVNADSAGLPADLARYTTKTVQVSGTFGAAGEITIQGSNDGTNWFTLTDSYADDALVFTSAGLKEILQNPLYIRPAKTTGDASLDVAVTIIGR